MVNEFDEAGNRIRVRFHGPDGSLSANGEGLAGWNSTFAPTGLELRRMGVGVDGKPSPNKEGVVVTEFKYDHMSRLISQRYLSVDGGAVPNSRGVHEYVAEFADDDKARLEKALDNKGKTIRDESGIGVYKSTYDELGRVHTTRFFDVDSVTPVAERDGWFGIMRDYDAYGNLVKTGRLSRSGDLEATAGGLAGYVQEFDSIGRVIAISSVGKFGESVSNSAGVFTTRHTYSLGDMVASTKTYNIAGKPTVDQNGIASTVSEIDSRGQVRKISWYGTDGVPQGFPANPSITSITKAYDERGRQVTEFFFDKNGKAASNANGRFGVRFIYDSKNQVIEEINLDANGLPLDTDSFPARTKFAYDAYGRDVLVQQLRADGAQPLSGVPLIIRVEYDSYGRRTKRQFEDSNGIVLHRASGRAIVRYQYDDFGRIVSERSYDARDSLVDRKDVHWATRTFTYNEFGEQSAKCMSALGRSIVPCGRDD
jgi:YD repeat-containing protein